MHNVKTNAIITDMVNVEKMSITQKRTLDPAINGAGTRGLIPSAYYFDPILLEFDTSAAYDSVEILAQTIQTIDISRMI